MQSNVAVFLLKANHGVNDKQPNSLDVRFSLAELSKQTATLEEYREGGSENRVGYSRKSSIHESKRLFDYLITSIFMHLVFFYNYKHTSWYRFTKGILRAHCYFERYSHSV